MIIEIKENIDNPEKLEKLFRTNKKGFEKAFYEIYPEITDFKISSFWKARFEYEENNDDLVHKSDNLNVLFVVIASLFTGFLIKLPQLFDISYKYLFYEKNAGLIVFFGLSLFLFLTKKKLNKQNIIISALILIISALYVNILSYNNESQTINLIYIHLPLLLWCLYGLIYIDFDLKDKLKRMNFIRHNGDIAILSAIILTAGIVLTLVTLGLFSAIDLDINEIYFDYVVVIGIVSSPIVSTYIVKKYPFVTNKIAPIIANIFSPLVLITLVIYLLSIVITGKDPYNDRDFLMIFNIMLLGVMAIILFSVTETAINKKRNFSYIALLILTTITLLVDLYALSAILYRLGEFGFTANRIAVLGSNLLIFGNLVLIIIELYKVIIKKGDIKNVEFKIASYLPIYIVWTLFIIIILPLIFGYK
jgi:hypothetical protein